MPTRGTESNGKPGAKPTPEEIAFQLDEKARLVVAKWHHGPPPDSKEFGDLRQEVIVAALRRLKNFRHGGKKTLAEYCYMSCYFSLRDVQRVAMKTYGDPKTHALLHDAFAAQAAAPILDEECGSAVIADAPIDSPAARKRRKKAATAKPEAEIIPQAAAAVPLESFHSEMLEMG